MARIEEMPMNTVKTLIMAIVGLLGTCMTLLTLHLAFDVTSSLGFGLVTIVMWLFVLCCALATVLVIKSIRDSWR